MSDLAFNMSGEPFELPPTMAAWRVRKLKPKGAPEVVYGRDGLPLFLPLDADVEDLRREARGEGRYRLDPVDDHNRPVPAAQSSYVCVHPAERAAEPTVVPPPAPPPMDATAALIGALLESQKQHTELARMYVSQFPVLANAMAGVVRTAGDVGLTARVPLVVPALAEAKPTEDRDQDDETSDDETDGDELLDAEALETAAAPEAYSWARVGQTFAEHIGPYVGPMIASAPSLAKLLGGYGRTPATEATRPGTDPGDPSPARGGASTPIGPTAGFDAALLVRLRQVMAQLTPDEEQFARSLIDEISPADMAGWIERLRALSIPEAVAYVRTLFREARAAAGNAAPFTSAVSAAQPAPVAPPAPVTRTAAPRAGYSARPGSMSPATAASAASSPPPPRRSMSDTSPPRRATPPTGDDARLRDAGTQAHLDQIERVLNPEERTAMRRHFVALSPSERSLFVATLLMLPIPDAVAVVRGQIGSHVTADSATDSAAATEAPPEPTTYPEAPRGPTADAEPRSESTARPGEAVVQRQVTASARKRPRAGAQTAAGAAARQIPNESPMPGPLAVGDASPASLTAATAPAPAERNAHTHLAEIESMLAPEELLVMHTLISELPPADRDAWLDKLLTRSVADGAAMLRAAIRAATSEPATAALAGAPDTARATASPVNATIGPKLRTHRPPDGSEPDDDGEPDDKSADRSEAPENLDDDHDDRADQDEPHVNLHDDRGDLGDDPHDRLNGGDPATADRDRRISVASRQPPAGPRTAATPATPPTTTTTTTAAELPTLDADALAHFAVIEDVLTLAERMRVQELASQRTDAELRRWYAELVALSIPDAIAKIRAELARSDSQGPSTTKGDVS